MSEELKPYFVEYTVTPVVMAEDENDAFVVARSKRSYVFGDAFETGIFVSSEVTGEKDLRNGWDFECVPYGGDGNTRMGEILAAG